MNEVPKVKRSPMDRVIQILTAAAAGGLIATLGWLATQAFDWNRWRGRTDLRIEQNEQRDTEREDRFTKSMERIVKKLDRIEEYLRDRSRNTTRDR